MPDCVKLRRSINKNHLTKRHLPKEKKPVSNNEIDYKQENQQKQ